MSEILDSIKSLPDISFIDNMTLTDAQNLILSNFYKYYEQITKKKIVLSRGDPYRIIMLACAQFFYQGLQCVDKAGKMNFIKYSYGDFLKDLAAFKQVMEIKPKRAYVKVLWKLAEPRESATPIPEGSRVTADYAVYFETEEYTEIPAGETETTLVMYCSEPGEQGNGYMAGELNTMVDPVAFIASVSNIETTSGGTGIESDESIAERTYMAPSSYSTAGPDDAYIYHAKSYSPEVGDVLPTSPSGGVVDIRFILKDGTIPSATMIQGMTEHLSQRKKRPLTDYVQVAAPEVVSYNVDFTFYVNSSDIGLALQIQKQVAQAVNDYKLWQSTKIGRDINPDELLSYIKKAGAKRVDIREPVFKPLGNTEVAQAVNIKVVYGGLEDD